MRSSPAERYAGFNVPELGVYAQVEFTLKPQTPVSKNQTRLLVSTSGEAAPGATVTIDARLSPPTQAAKAKWFCSPSGGWTVKETPTPEGRRFALTLSDKLSVGRDGPSILAQLPDKTLTQLVWLDVKPPFEATLRLPAFANTISGRTRAELTVLNRTPRRRLRKSS